MQNNIQSFLNNKDEFIQKAKRDNLKAKIKELDFQRVRAGFEPSIKNETTGQTWLEYYTQQIQDLRNQLQNL